MRKEINLFFQKVYLWMFIGLLVSGFAAFLVVYSPILQMILFSSFWVIFILFVVEIGIVIAISRISNKLSPKNARGLFFIFSFLNGLTLSSIFLIYTSASIVIAFVIASIMFLAMALYGLTTKKDLSKLGPILFGALIGLLVLMIIYIFVGGEIFNLIIGIVGILIFMGLTMYDNKMLKKVAVGVRDKRTLDRFAVSGALSLYLDLINLFLLLLRVLGRRR